MGSGQAYPSLRRKADGAARAASVGLAPDVPLTDEFGTVPLEEIPSSVRALANDRVRRTLFRLFWPLNESSISLLVEGGSLKPDALPPEEFAQILFLGAWVDFLLKGHPADATEALTLWKDWHSLEEIEVRLVGILTAEDGIGDEEAARDVLSARETASQAVLERIAMEAARAWEAGDVNQATALSEAIFNAPFEEQAKERSLEPLADGARRLAAKVQEITADFREWSHGQPTDPPREVQDLERLAALLRHRHPAAPEWMAQAKGWYARLIHVMCDEVRYLNEQGRSDLALEVATQANQFDYESEFREQLPGVVWELQRIVKNKSTGPNHILPIQRAPAMQTVNGIGTHLYGSQTYEPDPRYQFAILYFTFFWVPIFPLARYLVEDRGDDRWIFLGKTKWTWGMKVYFVVVCVLIWVAYSQYYVHQTTPDIQPTQLMERY